MPHTGKKTGLGRTYEQIIDCHIQVQRQDWEEHMNKCLIATGKKTGLGRTWTNVWLPQVKRQDWEEHMNKCFIATGKKTGLGRTYEQMFDCHR